MIKSILALLASFVVVIVFSLVTDAGMQAFGFLPPFGQPPGDGPLAIATLYRSLYAILGAYIVARLAPNRPMGHALFSGAFGTILGIAGAVINWNAGPTVGPRWYMIALVVTALPCAWLGAKLYERQQQ